MTGAEFLAQLRQLGVQLWAEGDTVRYRAPKDALTEMLRAEMARRKAEILELLRKSNPPKGLSSPPLRQVSRLGGLPLSFAQERLWFIDQLEPNNPAYNTSCAVRAQGPLDVTALEQTFNEIVRRHEIFRTTCSTINGRPVQVVSPALTIPLRIIDLREVPAVEKDATARRLATEEARRPFDLARGPFLRTCLLQLAPNDHVLLVTMHHFVIDGWSSGVFFQELSTLYEIFAAGKSSPLPDLVIQYADFAQWQRHCLQGDILESHIAYWEKQLAGAPAVLELPTDRPRPSIQSYRGASESLVLSRNLSEALKQFSRRESTTLFMALLAAFQTLLYRYTAQNDVIVGIGVSNRNHPEIDRLIGPFSNDVVLRTDLSGNPTFRALLGRVREVAVEAYAHQDLPFERLVEELHPKRDLAYHPICQVMFVLHQQDLEQTLRLPGLTLSKIPIDMGTARFDLFLDIADGQQLSGSLEYSTDLFEVDTIKRMIGHFQTLLESIAADPERRLSELSMLRDAEREQLLVGWNATRAEYRKCCVHELFEAQAERTPLAVAVIGEVERLTYRELDERAERLADQLRAIEVRPGVLVGICLERSVDLVVGLLGILKSGGAYVPIDSAYPAERIELMIEDSAMKVLLTQERLRGKLPQSRCRVVSLEQLASAGQFHASEVTKETASPEDLAYVIYTSGSTGRPKGVEIQHKALVNFLQSMRQLPGLTSEDVLLSVTTISFDIAGLELFLPLVAGACVVVVSREAALDGRRLIEQLDNSAATVMQATPATWRMLIDVGWSGRKGLKILCGGEALAGELASQLLERGASLWNLYGPTESTIWSTLYRVESVDGAVPIGRPIANTEIYILDRYLKPVPIGVPGDLHLGGAGLARGYLNRPELTEEKFIRHPFSADPNARLYKTGDLARYLPDGNVEFLGRNDHQVKVRGFRIELGEIEAVLGQHPAVKASVVIAREDTAGEKYLAAYLIAGQEPVPSIDILRSFLKQTLPEYMVPTAFVFLDSLPLTPNGKVDRKALPAPDRNRSELEASYVAPRDAIEVQLTRIWEKVLGRGPIGGRDNFFELGGHSLLAVQVIHQIREAFGKALPVMALFQGPTVEQLAAVLRKEDPLRDWASLVPLQPHGSKPPFFFLAGRSHFGDRLGSDQPVYRVVYQDLDREQPFVRIEDMAAHSIRSMTKIQPDGPYYLGGHSPGGIVAFEMAQQLQRQGQKVALLAICECWASQSRPPKRGKSRAQRLWQKASYHFHRTRRVGTKQELSDLVGSLKKKSQRLVGRRESVPLTRGQKEARAAVFEARTRYAPQVYSGRITLIRCSERPVWRDYDPLDGWGSLATEGVEVYEVPGSHAGIYQEPNVGMLAKTLSDVLYKAQAEMENGRMALIEPSVSVFDSRSFQGSPSARTDGKSRQRDSQSVSESLVGDS